MSIADVENAVRGMGQILGWYERRVDDPSVAVERSAVDPLLWALDWSTWLPWECRSRYRSGVGDGADWVLFDRDGRVAALVAFNRRHTWRGYDRLSLARNSRRAGARVAVLTSGWLWEIYDLEMRNRRFNDRLAVRFKVVPERADEVPEIAEVLYRWLSKERLW